MKGSATARWKAISVNAWVAAAIGVGALAGALAHGDDKHMGATKAPQNEQQPWGVAGDARAVKRTIEVRMSDDMRFTPDRIEIQQGEVVRFVVRNTGKTLHEFVIGTRKELDKHAALMSKFPGMEHEEPYMAHVKPGAAGEVIWNFNRSGQFEFACLVAGHYQAGMIGKIKVSRRS